MPRPPCTRVVVQRAQRRQQALGHLCDARDVHGGGERVVARLAHVHVVVGVDRRLRADLVRVRVRGEVFGFGLGVRVSVSVRARC